MKVRPLGERVLVRQGKAEKERPSGLLVVEQNVREMPFEGVVVEVGDGTPIVEVGMKVLFSQYGGMLVERDPEQGDLVLLRESDVLAVVE